MVNSWDLVAYVPNKSISMQAKRRINIPSFQKM